MLNWVKKDKNKNLILFVHGLKGGLETWSYDSETSFPSLISMDESFDSKHDIACFSYFTTFTNIYAKTKSWRKRLFTRDKRIKKNITNRRNS